MNLDFKKYLLNLLIGALKLSEENMRRVLLSLLLIESLEKGNIFGDIVMASAIIDRIVHHAEVIKIDGDSYKTKNFTFNFQLFSYLLK